MKLIESDRLYFRWVEEADLTEKYLSWMNDREVNQYMETWQFPHSAANIQEYITAHFENRSEPFFAICLKEENRHIGNIKLGPINWIHRYADVSLFIGEKDLWGQGYGQEAIKLISDYGLKTLNLHKICAGVYSRNEASQIAFMKAGFEPDGKRLNHVICEGKYIDVLYYARYRE